MADLVRIVTPDSGNAMGTKVYTSDGIEIEGVVGIEVDMSVDSFVCAKITLAISRCDIHAHPLLSLDSLRESAAAHGYRLEHGTVTLDKPTVNHT